jgi:hypothetical protein
MPKILILWYGIYFKFNAKDIVTEIAALSNVWLEGGNLTY